MAKIPIAIGNIKVPENQAADFNAFLRSHFGKKVTRSAALEGQGRPTVTEADYTEAELAQLITEETRQLWRGRFRSWKREQAANTDIDLS
jgi:hypothetical protein